MSKVKYQQLSCKENLVANKNDIKRECPCRSSFPTSDAAAAAEPFRRSKRWGSGKKPSRSTASGSVQQQVLSSSAKEKPASVKCTSGNLFSKMVKQFARGETVVHEQKTDLRETQVARCRGGSEIHAKKQQHVATVGLAKRIGSEGDVRERVRTLSNGSSRFQSRNSGSERDVRTESNGCSSKKMNGRGQERTGGALAKDGNFNNVQSKTRFDEEFKASVLSTSIPVDVNENSRFPGVCGIQNHGNTCFMNAILQCLSNTKPLILDLLRERGTNGLGDKSVERLSDSLVVLLRSLWTGQYTPELSSAFKSVVGKCDPQYEGSNQHDAQEFFLWLIDKVHSEINTLPSNHVGGLSKVIHRRQEELSTGNCTDCHVGPSCTHIYDLFQGQLKSTLSCASCEKQSNTFDTFLSISLPVPHSMRVPLFINLVPCTGRPRVIKGATLIPCEATVDDLRRKLSVDSNIPARQLILTEFQDETFQRTFFDSDPVALLQDFQEVYAIEAPKRNLKESREHLLLVCINRYQSSGDTKIVELPYVMWVPREATYGELQRKVTQKTWDILRLRCSQLEGGAPKLYVVDGNSGLYYLPDNVDHPLYTVSVDQALSMFDRGQHCGPMHVKMVVQWEINLEDRLTSLQEDQIVESRSFQQLNNRRKEMTKVSLQDCFGLYFRKEKLDKRNGWVCQSCSGKQGMKQLSLRSHPDVFVVHLKRFKQVKLSRQRTKLHTLVEFPLSSLSMEPFADCNNNWGTSQTNEGPLLSDLKEQDGSLNTGGNLYDLYAVCSHKGDMEGGHYTACCKNPLNGLWYLFDDTRVTPVQETDITTEDAYILFYQHRRGKYSLVNNKVTTTVVCQASTTPADSSCITVNNSNGVCNNEFKSDCEHSEKSDEGSKSCTPSPPPPAISKTDWVSTSSSDSSNSSKGQNNGSSLSATRWYFTVTSV